MENQENKPKETEVKKDAVKAATTKPKKEPLDKQDILCFSGALFLLVLAFLPMILRGLDPNYSSDGPITEEEVVVQDMIKKMVCNKHVEQEGYIYWRL